MCRYVESCCSSQCSLCSQILLSCSPSLLSIMWIRFIPNLALLHVLEAVTSATGLRCVISHANIRVRVMPFRPTIDIGVWASNLAPSDDRWH